MTRLIVFILLFTTTYISAVNIKGTTKDEKGNIIPFVSVHVKNTSISTMSNDSGQYVIQLKPGKYLIAFNSIGYTSEEKETIVEKGASTISMDIILKEKQILLNEVKICYKKNNAGRDIMRKARDKRKFYNEKIQSISYISNLKMSLEKELIKIDTSARDKRKKNIQIDSLMTDSTLIDNESESTELDLNSEKEINSIKNKHTKDTLYKDTTTRKHLIYLTESINEISHEKPSKYKIIVDAQHEYFGRETYFYSRDRLFTYSMGNDNAIPIQYIYSNPHIIYEDITDCDFNFYENSINYPAIGEKPFLSPLAASAELNYRFILYDSCLVNAKKIYKIAVRPYFKSDALFSGFIYIEDSTWAIKSLDLSINKKALLLCKEFNIKQEYQVFENEIYYPVKTDLNYTQRDENLHYYGKVSIINSNFKVNKPFPFKTFNNEIKIFNPESFNKDSLFWDTCRVIKFNDEDFKFIHESDSLKAYYQSEVFERKNDSMINLYKFEKIFLGYFHINRQTGFRYSLPGLISQVNPFGIGGYRHRIPLFFMKTFKNEMQLEANTSPDYGFANKDLKGSIDLKLLYYPKKFIGTSIRFGNNYALINNTASISQVFSRSNYIRNKYYGITQQMEIVNGLFADLSFDYAEKRSLSGLHLEKWTTDIFGKTLNTPIEFSSYNSSEISLRLGYRYKQKYLIKKRTKIILGSKYPEISLKYRKGLKNLFNSDEDFDYLEFKLEDSRKLARYGTINWQVLSGTFLNKTKIRAVEYKYFRGSDPFFFSNPLISYQLLGPTLYTSNAFVQAGFIHHFNGSIFNKLPLLNKLKMDASFGASSFSVPKENIYHFEMFAGIDKIIRIRTQLFKLGIYAVTAENTLSKAKFSFKIGLNSYNLYSKKWLY